MYDFRTALRDQLITKIGGWIGPSGSNLVKTISPKLDSSAENVLPLMVVAVRHVRPESPAEIGVPLSEQNQWLVHIYYLDKDTVWATGDTRQTTILGLLAKRIKTDPRLGNITSTDTEGNTTYVYDSQITDIVFDDYGVDQDYSFVSELYLTVKTDSR